MHDSTILSRLEHRLISAVVIISIGSSQGTINAYRRKVFVKVTFCVIDGSARHVNVGLQRTSHGQSKEKKECF